LNEEDGVAFASKNFLLKDIETTYDNETMAVGRISNGKVEKDKIRYTEIRDNSIPLFVDVNMMYELSKSVDEFFKLQQFTSYMRELFETIVNDSKLYDIFKKIRERNEYLSLTRDDFNYIMTLDLNIINKITSTFPYLGIIFREIWNSDIASRELKERNDQIQSLIDGSILTIKDGIWPAFTPDLISIALVTATQAKGSVLIHQWMFESRLFFVDNLIDMGAKIILCDPHRAVVIGSNRETKLRGITMSSPDIRAGVSMLIAAMAANGTSTINNIEQIDRGYQFIDKRLNAIGADITRID
ncbi:MAG: hypothetical protein ACK445_04480, partial [Bacteroidota bacterium]